MTPRPTIRPRAPGSPVALAAGLVYVAIVIAAFLWAGLILDIPGPLIILVGSTVVIASYQYHVEAQARARFDRELAVARDISHPRRIEC